MILVCSNVLKALPLRSKPLEVSRQVLSRGTQMEKMGSSDD